LWEHLIKLWQAANPEIQSALRVINKTMDAIGHLVLLVARKANVPESEIAKAMGKAV
jgi:ABC-type lipoprotein release transport system permease subunit|tara:strand:- start:86 stop:256 length:171 start_codon:yes stop_codon:yes gene_type:complete